MFKRGDKVRRTECFDQPGYRFFADKEYTVLQEEDGELMLYETGSKRWVVTRFELVKPRFTRNLPEWF